MGIGFRVLQGMTVSTVLGMWVVRALSHPHAHPMMLVMAAVLAALSEAGYRAGRAERANAKTRT
jgi:hypothetical protein